MMKIARASSTAIKATKDSPEKNLMVSTVSVIKKIVYSFPLKDFKDMGSVLTICTAR